MTQLVHTLRGRLFLLLLLFSVLPVTALGVWTLDQVEDSFEAATYRSLEAVTRAKAQALEQFVGDRQSEVEQIANLVAPQLDDLLATGRSLPDEENLPALEDGSPRSDAAPPQEAEGEEGSILIRPSRRPATQSAALEALQQRLSLILWRQERFEELLVIDLQGRVVASTYPAHNGRSAADLAYFVHGQGGTFLQPVFRSPITDRLSSVLSTPIQVPGQQTIGVLAARLNLSGFFDLVNDFTGLGATGEVLLGRIDQDRALLLAPTRHDPDAALELALDPSKGTGRPLDLAAQGRTGTGEAVDYREKEVFAAWEPVPSLDAGLVVKMDRDEAQKPVREAQLQILVLLGILLVAAILASVIAARGVVHPIVQLKRATDRISRGDFEVRLDDIRSRDEIGELARSFERMVAAIRYFRTRPAAGTPDEDLLEAEAREQAAAEAAARLDETAPERTERTGG